MNSVASAKRGSMILVSLGLVCAAFFGVSAKESKIVYPIQEMSQLECRFEKFSNLSSNCKQTLPILNTKDYGKYAEQNGGYNDYTRIYTVLWGASYKYGWDVGFGGHQGTDIATAEGTPVYAMADGEVIIAKNMIGWGNNVSIEHEIDGKKIVSNYSHLSKIHTNLGSQVKAGQKIGEVGNTGNSFGNHLHFQIDLDTPFHPYYYDYEACPYSYREITEQGVCFDELTKNTIDPLAFLESNGAILEEIEYAPTPAAEFQKEGNQSNDDIFNTTVYIGYNSSDVKRVQEIYSSLGYYTGDISGDYNDVLESVIAYQIDTGVIEDAESDGAGWFGPKTRAQTKKDYSSYLIKSGNNTKQIVSRSESADVVTQPSIQKIERTNLLTREEIEAKEIEDFMQENTLTAQLKKVGGNILRGDTQILEVAVKTRKGRYYKGNIPAIMTFEFDESVVSVFPKSLYNFNREPRDIKITGLKKGNTTLKVKVGNQVIETISLKVYESDQNITPDTAKIYGIKDIVLGETQTGIAVFRDEGGKRLINIPYDSQFTLTTNDDAKICLKRGSIENISAVYKTHCADGSFQDQVTFGYKDTVGGVLVFDYQVSGSDAKLTLREAGSTQILSKKNLAVKNPKGLDSKYAYHDEVLQMLEAGVVGGIQQGYFLEARELTKTDALTWIGNTLRVMKQQNPGSDIAQEIDHRLEQISDQNGSNQTITREGFISLAYEYLILDTSSSVSGIDYRDVDGDLNRQANVILRNNSWRDRFGENYFRPGVGITRGEASFVLAQVLQNTSTASLAVR